MYEHTRTQKRALGSPRTGEISHVREPQLAQRIRVDTETWTLTVSTSDHELVTTSATSSRVYLAMFDLFICLHMQR